MNVFKTFPSHPHHFCAIAVGTPLHTTLPANPSSVQCFCFTEFGGGHVACRMFCTVLTHIDRSPSHQSQIELHSLRALSTFLLENSSNNGSNDNRKFAWVTVDSVTSINNPSEMNKYTKRRQNINSTRLYVVGVIVVD